MPHPTTPQSPVPNWTESDYLIQNEFERLANRRIELKHQMDIIEIERKELDLEIGGMMRVAGTQSVRFGMHRLTRAESTKGGKLDRGRLLELGVKVETIERATTPKERGTVYITVSEIRGSD